MTRTFLSVIGVIGVASATLVALGASTPGLPARLDDYLTGEVKLTPEERARLLGGEPVTRLLDADESKEVAVFGAVWVDAPMHRYVDLVKDIEKFERGGGFTLTRRISATPRAEDFADMRMSDEDVADLRNCQVGSCKVKLDQRALERFQTAIDWNAPNHKRPVEALMRQLALEYVSGYVDGGDERLAVYRDKSRPTFVSREFGEMLDAAPELTRHMPLIRRYLLEYPRTTVRASASFLYLAGNAVRAEAHGPHQSPGDSGGRERDGHRFEDAVREPLLLDRARAARAVAGSDARRGLLVRDDLPRPRGRIVRVHRPVGAGTGTQRGAGRRADGVESDKADAWRGPQAGSRLGAPLRRPQ